MKEHDAVPSSESFGAVCAERAGTFSRAARPAAVGQEAVAVQWSEPVPTSV